VNEQRQLRGHAVNHRDSLTLVIFEPSASEAEKHVATLRNAGHSIRHEHAADIDSLSRLLESTEPDIILCGESGTLPDLDAVTGLLQEKSCRAPLIALTGDATADTVLAARRAGAMECVPYEPPLALQLAFSHCRETVTLRQQTGSLDAALQQSETRCRDLIESSRDAIAYIHEGMHIHANHSYLKMFGLGSTDEIEGTPLLNMIERDDHKLLKDFLREYHAGNGKSGTLEVRGLEPDGKHFKAMMEFSPSTFDAEQCIQLIIRTADNAELENQLEILTRQDILTGLANRSEFIRTVNLTIRAGFAGKQTHTVTYILVDNFKKLCENIGMSGGDKLIRNMADLLATIYGDEVTLARFADCAFTVLRKNSNEEDAHQLAERTRQTIEEHIAEIDGHAVSMTSSIGICVINEHSRNAENVLSRADLACEVARSSGGNQIHVHSLAVDESMDGDHEPEWDQVIRKTIDDERFYLAYQPVVSLNDNAGVRYEVLLRVIDEEGQVILPGQFISIAEKTGMIGEIDRWVLRAAARTLAQMESDEEVAAFFIKISGDTLADKEFPVWVFNTLKSHDLKTGNIVFEIPESAAASDLKNTMLFINSIRKIGCQVCLEHFGRHNQPQLLKHLNVDLVKIDGSLISNLPEKKANQSKVREIVTLAHENGKQCVAEHVHGPSDLALLWQYDIDFIQGNFVQEPSKELDYNFEEEIA
jgi:diguanylate cyclase (GGDEF)-like protein/PAS domain S-box-containing protein